ncbi:MAG: hypothetical protein HC896_03885 [Bacteroidales bacterium]|nr:hypothetical protein [Bacteroidales bacterium]
MTQILLYDFNELSYSSYAIEGFHAFAKEDGYRFKVCNRYPPFLKELNKDADWKMRMHGTLVLKYVNANQEFYFCVDVRDGNNASDFRGTGYHVPLLQSSLIKYYFKTNYNIEEIRNDNALKDYQHKILPALPFFAIRPSSIVPLIPKVNIFNHFYWSRDMFIQRLKDIKNLVAIQQLKDLYNSSNEKTN